MESRQRSPTPLLKTCRTCAHAKIKCDRTQDSGICDRCLRLGKECTYAIARGRRPPGPRSRSNKLLQIPERPAPSVTESPSASESITSDQSRTPPQPASSSGTAGDQQPRPSLAGLGTSSHDPFEAGQLSLDKGQELLDRFRTKLTPHFPFVIIADSDNVSNLRQKRPALCLALLAAASHDDVRLQRALGQMFNELVAARLLAGNFTCLDILQGLLVHLAWAHFQPRPKRYSQHLHLAISIVSDLRLDRAKNPRRWNVEGMSTSQDFVESLDEHRTFLGTYYLSSCTSIVLQKLRIVTLSSFITETANRLAEVAEYPTDQYLPYIIRLQRLAEDIDDVVKNESTLDPMQIQASVSEAKERVVMFKNSLGFSLSDCPLLVPQLHTIQLCLNQLSLPEAPFGLNNPQNASMQRLIAGLSESIVSAKSLVSVLLHTPPGQEVFFPNIVWVMLHCGFTLAARLDLLAADPRIGFMAEHLRQFSDVGHTIRQVVLRLESASSPDLDDRGDRDSFYHFAIRAKRVEKFYLQQQRQSADQQQNFSPQSLHVTMPTTSAGYTTMSTPTSDFSTHNQSLDYSLAPSMFSQTVAPMDGNLAYPNFIMPNTGTMNSNPEYAMEAASFLPESFIPFRSWGPVMGNDDGGGAQF
ncbi:zn 2cys6 transcription factor [Colletotrichum incanum]|uniref:Zn 2cys6 transcription factor n=1 Tax=Colletotrichum incanum TaxID=1573173 RepID=A0A162NII6_COLIC|nr:zn 2cys6 transcription factor [Colletotrichum incanum]OHW91288.1 zn 2cys6 transcription factor [Colletotrichum incanum]